MCDGKLGLKFIHLCDVWKPLLKRQWIYRVNSVSGRNFSVNNGCTGTKKDTEGPFPAAYRPREVERGWSEWWEARGFFAPDAVPSPGAAAVFSMVLPPPNVTGQLHLGHALACTVQDVLARWRRMRGESVAWLPGLDHAGIATQALVERTMWHEERLTRRDVGREAFERRAEAWAERQAHAISGQLRRLGLSLDWSREFYTMDAKQCAAVTEAFIHLFDAGLVYRDCSLVNWSCALQSAISDVEVVHRAFEKATLVPVPGHSEPVEFGTLTDFAYKLCDSDGEVVVSTTRLETALGDVAVAVHPRDPRYAHLRGARVWNPLARRQMPVVFDECVDMKLGTGALKVTPGHSAVDFDLARRHGLEVVSVITEDGTLGENCGQFSGLKRFDARRGVRDALARMGLLRGRRDHAVQVPFCSRSGDAVELLSRPQWFIRCKAMAEEAAAALQDGRLVIEPQHFEKVWYDWLYNIRDWCVSRQLWWGHRVPAYRCARPGAAEGEGTWVSASSEEHARRKAAAQLRLGAEEARQLSVSQDGDVLDTWFSSALVPFSALGWPEQSADFKKYYPLSLMETGHDILFFWVARMAMLGLQLTCRLPFEKILLHGILCDAHGRKMSKSLGNVVSPEDVIYGISAQELQDRNLQKLRSGLLSETELRKATDGQRKLFPSGIPECGADALRFTLASHNVKSTFINFDVAECHANSLFCNKLWQAARYTLLSLERLSPRLGAASAAPGTYDRWVLSRLARAVAEVERSLSGSDLHSAAAALRAFVHQEFCDVYLEATKLCTRGEGGGEEAAAACHTLLCCLDATVRCLAPFMPFLSEELYQRLPLERAAETVALAPYPTPEQWEQWRDEALESEMRTVLEVVSALRRLKGAYIQCAKRPLAYLLVKDEAGRETLQDHVALVAHLARCESVAVVDALPQAARATAASCCVGPDCTVYLQHQGAAAAAREDIANRRDKISKELDRLLKMTASSGYREKASPQIQSTHMAKIETLKTELKRLDNLKVPS
ncbi:valine--tRNA ligase-like [Bacillus rossius redtenbacheri]|uniref:valine--tRNA ligase-like n=1 Tax=Bacillus rossius redtenbacheri TaxID=93214 RepID=UPI002FDE4553